MSKLDVRAFTENALQRNPGMNITTTTEEMIVGRMLGERFEIRRVPFIADESHEAFHQRFWDIVLGPPTPEERLRDAAPALLAALRRIAGWLEHQPLDALAKYEMLREAKEALDQAEAQ